MIVFGNGTWVARTRARVCWVLLSLLASGCIDSESSRIEVQLLPKGVASYSWTLINVSSDDPDSADQARDFKDLIDMWRGDDYLLGGVNESRYIQARDLRIENGVLVARDSGLCWTDSLASLFQLSVMPDSTLHMEVERDEYVSSNGGWLPDRGIVRWPAGTTVIRVEMKEPDFDPTADFVAMFRRWKASQASGARQGNR